MRRFAATSTALITGLALATPTSAQGSLEPTATIPSAATATSSAIQPIPSAETPVPIHTLPGADGLAYGTWGAGADYKVSFHDGATFVPYLGRGVPELRPLRWCTASVRVGETELRTGEPGLRHAGLRAEYGLGGVVERYDLGSDGLEQSFVIASPPRTRGDLVIRGQVDTNLRAAERGAEHAPIVFCDAEGHPVIRYGEATAIDAAGRRQPMTTAWSDGALTLRLDAQWLANATYPLVVDPIIANIYSFGTTQVVEQVDLLHDNSGTQGNNWRAAIRWASATDADIAVRRFNDDGTGNVAVFTELTSAWSTPDCSLGLHRRFGRVLVAFTRLLASGDRNLHFHVHTRANMALSNTSHVVGLGTNNHAWRPDVASDYRPALTPTLLVVFQQESNSQSFVDTTTSSIRGVLVDVSAETSGSPFPISGAPLEDHERPAVNKTTSPGGDWTVANQVRGLISHQDTNVLLRRVDRSGGVSAATVVGQGNQTHELAPQLAGFGGDVMLACCRAPTSVFGNSYRGPAGSHILHRRYVWSGSTFTQIHNAGEFAVSAPTTATLTGIDIDESTGSHYVLSYLTSSDTVGVVVLGYQGQALRIESVFVPTLGGTPISGAIADDDSNDRMLIVYGENRPAINTVHVAAYVHPATVPPSHSGIGCSNAQLSWVGSQLIGDEDCAIRCTNLPAGVIASVLVGMQQVNQLLIGTPPIHSGCWLLVPNTGPGHVAVMPIGFGPTLSYSIDLPEFLSSLTLHFQGVYYDVGVNEAFLTDRLSVGLVK